MFFTETDQVFFADKRFTTSVNVHIYAKFFALSDNIVDFVISQIEFMTIFSSPTSSTVQITGRSRIKQNGPRNITIVFFTEFFFFRPSNQCGVYKEIDSQSFGNIRINIFKYFADIGIIWMIRIFNCFTDCFSLRREVAFRKLIRPVHQFFHVFIGIFVNIIECLFNAQFFQCI